MKLSRRTLVLFGLFFAAFFIRLIALNQSLWLDEGITARVISEYDLSGIITRFLPGDFHPPLYYVIVHVWSMIFGSSEIALRMPSVVASLIAGIFVYKITNHVSGITDRESWTPFFATAFFLFNPLVVYYSQEARMYMIATMFITMGIHWAMKEVASFKTQVSNEGLLNGILSGVCFSLALATFYGSVFIIIPVLVYLLFRKRFLLLLENCVLILVTFLLLSPLLFIQLQNARNAFSFVPNWNTVLGTASLKNLMLVFIKFTTGRISFEPKFLYYVLAGIWTTTVWAGVVLGGKKHKVFLLLVICSLSLGTVFSLVTPLLQYFRFLFLLPLISILLAIGVKRTAFRLVILIGFIMWSFAYLLFPAFHREDWSSLARLLDANKPVYAIPSSMDALTYYRPDLKGKILDIRTFRPSVSQRTVLVLPYTFEIYGFDYARVLGTMGYTQQKVRSVRLLTVEEWSKK